MYIKWVYVAQINTQQPKNLNEMMRDSVISIKPDEISISAHVFCVCVRSLAYYIVAATTQKYRVNREFIMYELLCMFFRV